VLAKLERTEGLKQSELAEMMEMQPISLTRLIDRLCDNDLIERRSDANDRRANRLYLRPAARPLLKKLGELRAEITRAALNNMSSTEASDLVRLLETIKDNVRDALQSADNRMKESRYG
jgi:DNA-binding MarR family transcriptional regulator